MKLHKIKLENIRSYISEEVVFPEGKVLLWGNIGSGKSSVLYAIDFVLFGLQRSELAGASLLRNGTDEGSVELFFSLGEKEYVLKRNLKRTKTGVVQDAGYIIRDGVKQDKTAIELKQIVLELLHYPKDLLTKNKTLIYRYTVYTPQEEMKTILLGPKEERLDTLRKVFGVDKYKRIKENSKIIISELKERKKIYEGASADLQEKIVDKEKKDQEKIALEQRLQTLVPTLEDLQRRLKEKKEQISLLETKKEELTKVRKDLALALLEERTKKEEVERDSQKERLLREEVLALEKDVPVIPESVKEKIISTDTSITLKEKELRTILNLYQELKTKKEHAMLIKTKIESLNTCPTCFQDVSPDYKQRVFDSSIKESEQFARNMQETQSEQQKLEGEIQGLRKELEALRRQEGEVALVQLKIQNLSRKKMEQGMLVQRITELHIFIQGLRMRVTELEGMQSSLSSLEDLYVPLKGEYEQLQVRFQRTQMEKMQWELSLKHIHMTLQSLVEDIQKKTDMRDKKEKLNSIQFWLTESFIPLMETMEKNILFKVHEDFTSLFEKWFSLLIDNQSLVMSLDEEYSPKISQNGYDIEYEFLSGGEKTAAALAYRLALNQIINTLNVGIQTQDLLILDEPTDGFSSEQLDRLKMLMDEIQIPQIILVSHEAQIECFADHIIRFEKRDHITKVVS